MALYRLAFFITDFQDLLKLGGHGIISSSQEGYVILFRSKAFWFYRKRCCWDELIPTIADGVLLHWITALAGIETAGIILGADMYRWW